MTAKGWILSPAYDMNPTLNEYQSLLVSSTSNKAELSILLDACEDYMLNRKTAEKIISEVIGAVKGWRELATRLGIPRERWICLPECWMNDVSENNCFSVPNYQIKTR